MTIEAFFTVATGIHYCSLICSVHIKWTKVLRKVGFIDWVCKVIIVEEKPKDGRGNIPYYGGMQRMKEMGWNQEISEILHSDKITLQHVIELRSMWNKLNV